MNRLFWKNSLRLATCLLITASLATIVADCDEGNESAGKAPVRAIVQPGACVVRGSVKFPGPRPAVKTVGGECCPGASPALDESAVVNDNGTLRNVLVYVKAGPNVQSLANESGPFVLDQKDCRYEPHVLAVRTGNAIDVTSHDAAMHNVNVQATVNAAVNFSVTAVGATHRLTFTAPETIHVKCDVHPWMSAYICVLDHPFFAVTGEDGTFRIGRLPAGTYTLAAWHEKYGTIERQFTVSPAGDAEVTFEYK